MFYYKEIISHSEYKLGPSPHDIALIRMNETLGSSYYMPACLPPWNKIYTGMTVDLYGWGRTVDTTVLDYPDAGCSKFAVGPWSSNVLRKTTQKIISNKECEESKGNQMGCINGTIVPLPMNYTGLILPDMICGVSPGRGECQGDSGGSNTVELDGKHFVVGVNSWSFGCAKVIIY